MLEVSLSGLVVASLILDSGSQVQSIPGGEEGDGFLWAIKILKHALLWRGNKAVGPMSQIYGK
jgi:hypothetical protein